jgi:hypothetical protein
LWTLGTEIFFLVLPVFEQQKPNRTKPKPVGLNRFRFGFGFKILKLIMSVWFIFLCKNQTEPDLLTPSWHHYFVFCSFFFYKLQISLPIMLYLKHCIVSLMEDVEKYKIIVLLFINGYNSLYIFLLVLFD